MSCDPRAARGPITGVRLFAAWLVLALAAGAPARADDPPPAEAPPASYADKPPSFWIGELRNPKTRGIAEGVLTYLGDAATADLAAALADPDPKVRQSAARLLRDAKTRLDPVVLPIVAALGDTDRGVVIFLLGALRRAGAAAAPAATAVGVKLDDPIVEIRIEALRTIGALGAAAKPSVPRITALLADPKCSGAALGAITQLGVHAADALPQVLERETAETKAKKGVHDALAAIAPADPRVHAILRKQAETKDAKARAAAIAALGVCAGGGAEAVIPDLGKALSDPDRGVRLAAAAGVKPLGARARPILPQLGAALSASDLAVASSSAQAIESMHAAGEVVPDLVRGIVAHRFQDIREVLERLGAAAAGPLASIVAESKVEADRATAMEFLAKLPPEAIAPHAATLRGILETPSAPRGLRQSALAALVAAKLADGRLLFGALASGDEFVRSAAERALREDPAVGEHAADALKAGGDLRKAALQFLRRMPVPEVAPLLEELLSDPDAATRLAAARALRPDGGFFSDDGFGSAGSTSPAFAAVVAEALTSPEQETLQWACMQTFQLGAHAGPTIPVLVSHALRADSPVAEIAASSLGFLAQPNAPVRDAALAALHAALSAPERRARIAVLRSLLTAGDTASCTPERIVDCLRADQPAEVTALATLTEIARSHVPLFEVPQVFDFLREQVATPSTRCAENSARMLIAISSGSAAARQAVVALWDDPKRPLRDVIANRWSYIPGAGERIAGEACADADRQVRLAAVRCVLETGQAPPSLAAKFRALTGDSDKEIAAFAREAAQRFGDPR